MTCPNNDNGVKRSPPVDLTTLMAPGFVPRPEEPRMSWTKIVRLITAGSLGGLDRSDRCQAEYDAWAAWVRSHGVSLEQLLRIRLGWPAEQAPQGGSDATHPLLGTQTGTPNVLPGSPPQQPPHSAVKADASLAGVATPPKKTPFLVAGTSLTKLIPNDWPYAVPDGARHLVVWCDVPIVHPALFAEASLDAEHEVPYGPPPEVAEVLRRDRTNAYAAVGADGVRGLLGWSDEDPQIELPVRERRVVGQSTLAYTQALIKDDPKYASASEEERDSAARPLATQLQKWAGRHIEAMVRELFPPEQYQSAWFCNPPHLRTVPGLSHFHILVQAKSNT